MCLLSQQGKTEQEAKEVGGKIFTFGSYRLGVHGKGMWGSFGGINVICYRICDQQWVG